METLKQSLEQDSWTVADIPYTYKTYFDILFKIDQQTKPSTRERSGTDDDIFRSARPDVNDLDVIRKLALGDALTLRDNIQSTTEIGETERNEKDEKDEKEVVEIKKNELVVNGRRFKVNHALLVLIKVLCDYYNLAFKFVQLKETAISKLFDLVKVFSCYFHILRLLVL